MKGKARGRAKPPLVMRKELTQEMVTYGTDLLCPGLPIQNSLYLQLRAVHGTATFILGVWNLMKLLFCFGVVVAVLSFLGWGAGGWNHAGKTSDVLCLFALNRVLFLKIHAMALLVWERRKVLLGFKCNWRKPLVT